MIEIILVSQNSCFPCKALKMMLEDKKEEFESNNLKLSYLNLDELEDKEEFTDKHQIMATPHILFKKGEDYIGRLLGKQNVEQILEAGINLK